jgi:glycosyltransferase involved in cell wall biosynthesis
MIKKLAVDCSRLNDKYLTGTHRFLVGFLNEIVKNDSVGRQKGFEYTFFFKEQPSDEKFDFIKYGKVVILGNKPFYTQLMLLKELSKFDFFIFPWQTCPFLGFLNRKKMVAIIHDSGFSSISKVTTFFTQLICGKVFSVSETTAKKLVVKSTVLGEGVDSKVFYKIKNKELEKYKKDYDIPSNFILSLGRVEKRKNIYNNLRAFSIVKKYYPKLKYVFIGNIVEDENLLYSFIKSLGIEKQDVVFKRFVEDVQLNIYLNSMNLMLFTPFDEGFGLPVVEAYSVGKPVVLSNIDVFQTFKISKNQFVDPNNPESIAEGVVLCLKDSSKFFDDSIAVSILKRFSWENSAKVFFKAIK